MQPSIIEEEENATDKEHSATPRKPNHERSEPSSGDNLDEEEKNEHQKSFDFRQGKSFEQGKFDRSYERGNYI